MSGNLRQPHGSSSPGIPQETFGRSGLRSPEVRIYRFADRTVASPLGLAGLPAVAGVSPGSVDMTVEILPGRATTPAGFGQVQRRSDERGAIGVFRTGPEGAYLLRFPGLADFSISEGGDRIRSWPAAGAGDDTLCHLLQDQVLPRALAHTGRLVLHAAAARLDGQAIAFVGGTGAGKSTLAASFHAAGNALLSDDGLALSVLQNGTRVIPTYPSLRLWPDAVTALFTDPPVGARMANYSTKQRLALPRGMAEEACQPAPLGMIFVLAPEAEGEGITLTRLSPRDACMGIVGNAFRLDPADTRRAGSLLQQAARVAERVPAFRLAYQREFALLPSVRTAIIDQHNRRQRDGGQPPGAFPGNRT